MDVTVLGGKGEKLAADDVTEFENGGSGIHDAREMNGSEERSGTKSPR